jgi:hypothetical protein
MPGLLSRSILLKVGFQRGFTLANATADAVARSRINSKVGIPWSCAPIRGRRLFAHGVCLQLCGVFRIAPPMPFRSRISNPRREQRALNRLRMLPG